MYTGEVAAISNQATWRSVVFELEEEDDGTIADLSDPTLTVEIAVTISATLCSRPGLDDDWWGVTPSSNPIVTADLDNAKAVIVGPGFQWQFEVDDLKNLRAGTYRLGAKVTIDGFVTDLIDGTVVLIEGNR